MKKPSGGLSIVVVPEESGETRTFRFSERAVRWGLTGAVLLTFSLVLMAFTWGYLALQTSRYWKLQSLADSLQAERAQVVSLAEELSRVEDEYDRLRSLFGMADMSASSELWLPPTGLPVGGSMTGGAPPPENLPTIWPLTEPGFITQPLVPQGSGNHPGLDIAVSTGSYVRSSGGGRVVRVGEDPSYGVFVVLEHAEGYQTVYAHVSEILVERGLRVRPREVIALSGSTGQSTALHLHFELLLDGIPIDPLSMVEQPG